ncbi:MAG: glycosyltransferase family 2 protein [Treponema sp.]|jgi:glycosyltransferase involved in cell wall biosynthesis|nr:glycosyltransferase family 2 protein [Treponema sp.]
MEKIRISIITPVYNVEKYLDRCFGSIVKQSCKNLECIFIDDGSTDNSCQKLAALISEYSGETAFTLVRHEKNRGLSAARNTGIMRAGGDYVYFLDADDEITGTCMQSLASLAVKYPGVDLVQGNARQSPLSPRQKNTYDITDRHFPEYSGDSRWIRQHYYAEPTIPTTAWNKLIRTDFIAKNGLYFKEGIIHEDDHWEYFAAKCISSIAFTKDCCYIHHITPNSIMTAPDRTESLRSWILIIEEAVHSIDIELFNEEIEWLYGVILFNIDKIKNGAGRYDHLLPEYKKYLELFGSLKRAFWKTPFIFFKKDLKQKLKFLAYKRKPACRENKRQKRGRG